MKILSIIILSFLLSGCFGTTKPLVVKTEPIKRIPLVLPAPDEYFPREVKWIIITPDNAKKIFAMLKKSGQPVAIIGVDGEGYKLLALNNSDKLKFIKQLQAQIQAYKNYYIAVEKRDAEINKKAKEEATESK